MNFTQLTEYFEEEYGCSITNIGDDFHLVRNCIHGTRCIIQDLEFYDTPTLCHYFLELQVDVPKHLEDFYHVYMSFRANIKEPKNR
ncbi:hypothetical protein [Flavobacterium poyangense]|uniref:hypothetical protein n=1 Tax=Flavobacterium poyangense TaxID=2204302 RepID=UPI00141DD0DC|nr:hypothetical protein [Flavobacterium sp. JXAS1]